MNNYAAPTGSGRPQGRLQGIVAYSGDTGDAWGVDFYGNSIGNTKFYENFVRAVSGGTSTTSTTTATTTTTLRGRFVDNGDGTITDNQTGLMREKKDYGDAARQWLLEIDSAGLAMICARSLG